jgi:hypothetical protein
MPSRAFQQATILGSDGTLNTADLAGLATVANTGSYTDLTNKPTLTPSALGAVAVDLSNAPSSILNSNVTLTPAAISDQTNTSTGYFDLPSGTTAERPGTTQVGMTRYNTTINNIETYNGTEWVIVGSQTAKTFGYNSIFGS